MGNTKMNNSNDGASTQTKLQWFRFSAESTATLNAPKGLITGIRDFQP